MTRPLQALLHAVLTAAAWMLPAAAQAQAAPVTLTVSAAASLTEAFRDIGQAFEASRPASAPVAVRFNFAASGVLLQQVQQGAPVDVLATADQETMDRAAAARLIEPATRADFAANQLVMVIPTQGGTALRSLPELNTPAVRRVAMGKPATVPAGRYTQQVLERAQLWQGLQAKLVMADSVRQTLDYVARGEVEAAFVYRTDAALMPDRVRVALTPDGQSPITYPIAVVADSRQKAAAQDFVAFVRSEAGLRILARFGFSRP
jgi:molybdate transport system substrate-binding protein